LTGGRESARLFVLFRAAAFGEPIRRMNMPTGYGTNAKGVLDGTDPLKKVSGAKWGGNPRNFREVLDLANADVKRVVADTNLLFKKPRGTIITGMSVVSSVSLGTSTLAFGVAGATSKYGAAKAYGVTAKARVDWYEPAAMDDDDADGLEEVVFVTIGTADLPASGIVIIDMEVLSKG
jgi:hypothetical protein